MRTLPTLGSRSLARLLGLLLCSTACGTETAVHEPSASAPVGPRSSKLLSMSEGTWFEHRGVPGRVTQALSSYELLRGEVERPGLDARRAVALEIPGSWEVAVEIPPEATLSFSLRTEAPDLGGRYLPLSVEVVFRADEEPAPREVSVWSRVEAPRPPDGGVWREARADLSALAGRRGWLAFRVTPGPGFPAATAAAALPGLRLILGAPAIGTSLDQRPNVLVITVDTLRRDSLAPYGGDPRWTPDLAALAARGVVVEQSWSTASWTLPSYASFVSGEYPSTHGAGRDYDQPWDAGPAPATAMSDEVHSLVEVFDAAGYRTQAFHNNAIIRRGTGIERGFDAYLHYGATGRAAVNSFASWLGTRGERPFFCFLHLSDPHSPYIPPASYEPPDETPDPLSVESMKIDAALLREQGVPEGERESFKRLYAAVVGSTDELVGDVLRLLERDGLAENTLVVFHVDHGEEFWDHGGWFHGEGHHVELVRTPLLFAWPGHLPAGTRLAREFRGVDVLPTMLDLVGLWTAELDASVEGISLAEALRGNAGPEAPPALSEWPLYGDRDDLALTSWPWRLHLRAGRPPELFDVAADPEELRDVAAEHPERVTSMERAARQLRDRARARARGTGRVLDYGADTAHALGQLGYAAVEDD